MVKRDLFFVTLAIFVAGLILFNIFTIYYFNIPLSPVALTGKAVVETGYVVLYVGGGAKVITIITPENVTYDSSDYTCSGIGYPKCSDYRYILPVNATADFLLEEVGDVWKYTLYDLKHGVWINETPVPFTPGNNISFVRWGNRLTIFANERDGDWINNSVVFTVDVPNSNPLIQNFTQKLYVCEGERLNSVSGASFNIYDIDEEDFSNINRVQLDMPLGGGSIFGLIRNLAKTSNYISPIQIISVTLTKAHVGSYGANVNVIDSSGGIATNSTNITVIAVNNAPVIQNNLGAQTIYTSGVGSTFYHDYDVSDVEVNSGSGNLTFNLTSGGLSTSINESTGEIRYTPSVGYSGTQTYQLRMCVVDRALTSVHENFSICSARGYASNAISVCDDFSITITDVNREPTIDSYTPSTTNFSVSGTTPTSFSVVVSDADMVGAYPDINWYVDGVLRPGQGTENQSTDSFSYTFGCGVSGIHNVTVIVSDGLVNTSVMWNISVENVNCAVTSDTETSGGSGGGGGGGGGGAALSVVCSELWSCLSWGICQNVERSFGAGSLSVEDFSSAKDLCAQNDYDDRFCGFQITKCFDLQQCNNTRYKVAKPIESRVCYFTENPSCFDGITNCHDDSCELLADCGGPCGPCATCSDGKKNQGENGVDCGGPCPFACESESPFGMVSVIIISLFVAFVIVAIFIIIKLINILRFRFLLSKKKKR